MMVTSIVRIITVTQFLLRCLSFPRPESRVVHVQRVPGSIHGTIHHQPVDRPSLVYQTNIQKQMRFKDTLCPLLWGWRRPYAEWLLP
jgi:hypothetical protein